MTPQQSPEFFGAQLARAQKGLEAAKASRNTQLAALNARQMFKGNLMQGLLCWRRRENPTAHLESAVQAVAEAFDLITTWDASFDIGAALPTARASLLARLVGRTIDLPAATGPGVPPDTRLDALLCAEARKSEEVDGVIEGLRSSRRTQLAAETYANYFLILAGRNSQSTEALVRRGEALFLERTRDAFYSGGDQTEGGGPDNALTVDYRLGCVLKLTGAPVESIHAWAW